MTYWEIIERIKILETENQILLDKIKSLEEENKKLKKELDRPERMTDDENRAYWGIFG